MKTLNNEAFVIAVSKDMQGLLSLSTYIQKIEAENIQRLFLGRLNLEAAHCEEVLDTYGAQNNQKWHHLRKISAVIKGFSKVYYTLLHIRYASPSYFLLPLKEDFKQATEDAIREIHNALKNACQCLCKLNSQLFINLVPQELDPDKFIEHRAEGLLERDRFRKEAEDPGAIAVYLATSFLNLAEESSLLKIYTKLEEEEYASAIPEEISEEKLRLLEDKFHNLQSLYDTYLSGSDVAQRDPSLPVLRGQISVVFHLLECATNLTHYYERHRMYFLQNEMESSPIFPQALLKVLMQYFVAFPERYILASQKLCKEILKHYAEMGEIEVPIPNYRGFHIRPSTLIAKIVGHYGCDVTMILGNTEYNAAMPLDLFRANEEINQKKRKSISLCLTNHRLIAKDVNEIYDPPLMKKILRMVFLDLLEKQKIIIYDNNFSFEDIPPLEGEPLGAFATRGIALYQAMGKMDIVSDITVIFKGDKRVLEDLESLAKNGYGEDKFGNNIVLPPALSYLRRESHPKPPPFLSSSQ